MAERKCKVERVVMVRGRAIGMIIRNDVGSYYLQQKRLPKGACYNPGVNVLHIWRDIHGVQ